MAIKIRLSDNLLSNDPLVEELKLRMQTYTNAEPTVAAMQDGVSRLIKYELMLEHLKNAHPRIYRELLDWFMEQDYTYET